MSLPHSDPVSTDPASSLPPAAPSDHSRRAPGLADRLVALLEVTLCSDYPTQILLGGMFAAAGIGPTTTGGALTLGYVMLLSFSDTVLLVGLMLLLMRARGERATEVLLGRRPVAREIVSGLLLVPVALIMAFIVLALVQLFAPWLHTVAENPLQALIQSPQDAWLFASVVVVAGGVREELQRAFLLHRFEHWLGGRVVGVVVTSISFGAGHALQGVDAALATGTLGAFWAVLYYRRRSAVAPMVSHAGFNVMEILQFLALGR